MVKTANPNTPLLLTVKVFSKGFKDCSRLKPLNPQELLHYPQININKHKCHSKEQLQLKSKSYEN